MPHAWPHPLGLEPKRGRHWLLVQGFSNTAVLMHESWGHASEENSNSVVSGFWSEIVRFQVQLFPGAPPKFHTRSGDDGPKVKIRALMWSNDASGFSCSSCCADS